MAKKNAAPTKSEILAQISKDTGLAKKQVSDVFESLGGVVKKSLKGSGLFTLPGLLKMKVVKKPATKAREGVNPFTGRLPSCASFRYVTSDPVSSTKRNQP